MYGRALGGLLLLDLTLTPMPETVRSAFCVFGGLWINLAFSIGFKVPNRWVEKGLKGLLSHFTRMAGWMASSLWALILGITRRIEVFLVFGYGRGPFLLARIGNLPLATNLLGELRLSLSSCRPYMRRQPCYDLLPCGFNLCPGALCVASERTGFRRVIEHIHRQGSGAQDRHAGNPAGRGAEL